MPEQEELACTYCQGQCEVVTGGIIYPHRREALPAVGPTHTLPTCSASPSTTATSRT